MAEISFLASNLPFVIYCMEGEFKLLFNIGKLRVGI